MPKDKEDNPSKDIDVSSLLPLTGDALTIDAATGEGNIFADQLERLTGGSPIVVRDATREATGNGVTVMGKASLLNMADMPVTATASRSGDITVRFTLIDGQPDVNSWHFSRSFPDLPSFNRGARPSNQLGSGGKMPNVNLLDRLSLSDAAFVLTTAADSDPVTRAPVQPGFNFVARLAPADMLGLLGSIAGGGATLPISGPVVIPKSTELTLSFPEMSLMKFPWQSLRPAPGIHLTADLGVDKTVGDTLRFHDVGLRIYCPHASAWAKANPTYRPAAAAAAKLEVPSAALSLDITGLGFDSPDTLMLFGLFEGLTLGKLEQLADAAGGGDLASSLPDDVRSALGKLNAISLDALMVQFGKGFAVGNVGFAVGLPGIDTTVLPGFNVRSLTANFNVARPFDSQRSLSVTLGGVVDFVGAPFDIEIDLPGVDAHANMTGGVEVPLGTLFREVGLPGPPDLTINELQMAARKDGSRSVAAGIAEDPPWTLDLGPTALTISDVSVRATKDAGGITAGSFGGTLALGDELKFEVRYDTPGDFVMRADLYDVKLSQLIAPLNQLGLELPAGFDVDIEEGSVMIERQGGGLAFNLLAAVGGLGTLAFTARKQEAWGIAVGLDLNAGGLSSVPWLQPLAAFESFVGLEQLLVVISSLAQPDFQFPDSAHFDVPMLASQHVKMPSHADGLVRGMNVYASLSAVKSDGFRSLAKFLGLDMGGTIGVTLSASLPDPSADSRLFISFDQEIQKGMHFNGALGVLMRHSDLAAFLNGDLSINVQGKPITFSVTALMLPQDVLISGTMRGTLSFGPVTLSNVALLVGLTYEGAPTCVGLAATLDLTEFEISLESSIALFYDTLDPTQTKNMLAGSLDGPSLKELAQVLARQRDLPPPLDQVLDGIGLNGRKVFDLPATAAAALDSHDLPALAQAFAEHGTTIPAASESALLVTNRAGQVWHLTDMTAMPMLHYSLKLKADKIEVALDPQLYFAPQRTFIGALQFPEGFYVCGELDIPRLSGRVEVLISPARGIAVDVDISPVIMPGRNSDFFSITGARDGSGPHLSLSSYEQPEATDTLLRPPHFKLSGKMRLLGADLLSIHANVGAQGLSFQAAEQVAPWLHLDLSGTLDAESLDVGGKIVVGVDRHLDLMAGSLDVKVNVNGSLAVGQSSWLIVATFKGGFDFNGISFDIPEFQLDTFGPALAHIADTLWGRVSELIKKSVEDPLLFLKWLRGKIIQGVGQTAQEVGTILQQNYQLLADGAADTMKKAGYPAADVANALQSAYGVTPDEAAKILRGAGYAANEVKDPLTNAFGLKRDALRSALGGAGFAVEEVNNVLDSPGDDIKDSVGSVVNSVGGFFGGF
ncbi:MAG TPA: hypothetical protein VGC87_17730 [Pyrinomonadaceae bacterium]|jgi:hypothetical protein